MAPSRKSPPKSRGALEASTSLPAATADLVAHGGEQAARLTEDALAASAAPAVTAPKRNSRKIEAAGKAVPGDRPVAMPDLPSRPVAVSAHPAEAAPDVEDQGAGLNEVAAGLGETAAATPPRTIEHRNAAPDEGHESLAAAEPKAPVVETSMRGAEMASMTGLSDMGRTIEHAGAETSEAVVATTEDARSAAQALEAINATVADAVRTNIEQAMSHWAALMEVRSVPEAITLHTQHLQRRMVTFASQGRQFTVLAQKLAADAIEALRHRQSF